VPVITKKIYPVAKRFIKHDQSKNKIIFSDFESGIIKKIWDLNPGIAKSFIFIDPVTIEQEYPSIDVFKGDKNAPYYNLLNYKSMPASEWSKKKIDAIVPLVDNSGNISKKPVPLPEYLVKKNGGWIVNEGIPSTSKNYPCDPSSKLDKNTANACSLVTILAGIQNRTGYHFKSKAITTSIDGKTSIKISSDPSVHAINIEKKDYDIYLNADLLFDAWVRTTSKEKARKAVNRFTKEARRSTTGDPGALIKIIHDYNRWVTNIWNNGDASRTGTSEFKIHVPENYDTADAFSKNDFIPTGTKFSSTCNINRASGHGSPVLVNRHGHIVPTRNTNGTPKQIGDVIGDTDPAKLKSWKWACVSAKEPGDAAIVPETFRFERVVDAYRVDDKTLIIKEGAIADVTDDIVIATWNALVKSSIARRGGGRSPGVIRDDVIESIEKTSGTLARNRVERIIDTRMKEPVIDETGNVIPGPFIAPRKSGANLGIIADLDKVIKNGDSIVGIQSNIDDIFKQC
jgi:hypothetical protein